MNGRVGSGQQNEVLSAFEVSGMNDNGRRFTDMCNEKKKMCAYNLYFYHKDVHKYTWVRERELKQEKSLTDYILVEWKTLNYACFSIFSSVLHRYSLTSLL